MKPRKRTRRQFGLAPVAHATDARNWQKSAGNIIQTAEAVLARDPCRAIEHFTDAIAEGTVAEVQFHQAGDKGGAEFASRFVSSATHRQRQAVKLCRRK